MAEGKVSAFRVSTPSSLRISHMLTAQKPHHIR
jgi:hypothetical protein